eukprot:TRINITY_DN17452_c0_g1_i1.p1 TRINITY_DN17452_c0_g1~~TRINITY_DN17452_c0_g1_i1.p1  ORF type:complete len:281 (-),score=51.11 TRINITY_DN17452_c0_g1_i1:118-960(-)
MDGDEIGVVLSRASELRSKITICIDKATRHDKQELGGHHGTIDGESDDESESLLNIRDALESLEKQLSSLQDLQQQQRYEREATLAEIDHSRTILLKKLKEYKGEDLEVIHEVSSFAGETVERDDDLLLPPYPTRLPDSLISEASYFPSIPNKFSRNGIIKTKAVGELGKNQTGSVARDSPKGIRLVFGMAAKTVLTIVSVISILSIAGFEPRLRKRSPHFRVLELFQKPAVEEKRAAMLCPPGKVLVTEDGNSRCLVKERIEIPFEHVVTTPDVSYGCG